jgi:hypothetical protein
MHQGYQSLLIPGVNVGRIYFCFFEEEIEACIIWGRRKARAICRVSKSLLEARRGPERRSAAAIPTIRGKCIPPLSKKDPKVVTLECFIEFTTSGHLWEAYWLSMLTPDS